MENPIFMALADPSRRKLMRLLQKGPCTPGTLTKAFPFTNGALSHHLNLLKAADLVRCERQGKQLFYSLNTTVLEDAMLMVATLFKRPHPKGGNK